MKKLIHTILASLMILSLAGCGTQENSEALYTPGTYSAEAQGMQSKVSVSLTVDEHSITELTIDSSKETEGIGDVAAEPMKERILENQNAEVEVVSGATITSNAILSAVNQCLNQAQGIVEELTMTAGTYTASAKGHKGEVTLTTTVSENEIQAIEITEISETYGIGYGMATTPAEVLPNEIVAAQSLAVDSNTGATVTSKASKQAVADSIPQAGGNPDILKNRMIETTKAEDAEYAVDVVVIGAGGAGLSAAISAKDQGADVLVLEKQGISGGATARSGGKIVAANTKWQEAQGIVDTPEMMEAFFEEVAEGELNHDLINFYSENSAENMYWLEANGVQFKDVEAIHSSIATWRVHNPYGGGGQVSGGSGNGAQLTVPLTAKFNELGGEIMYNCTAKELLTDQEGTVIGVVAYRPDGSKVTVHANSVVICTGGYAKNEEMMKRYEDCSAGFSSLVPNGNIGEGLTMAVNIGAQEYVSPATQVIYVSNTSGVGIKEEAGLIVNSEGKRVVNEYTYQYHVGQGIAQSGSAYGYYIASANDPNQTVQYAMTLESTPHASTAEELAALIDVDADVLKATIDRYNELCAKGEDEDFHKPQDKMIPIEGELYAIKLSPSVTVTFGGLVIDEQAHVLNEQNEPIIGLYAAGEVAMTGLVNKEYPACGLAIGAATFFGKVAGESAAMSK